MITDSDLVLTPDGRIYHLDLLPEEVADSIIIVGDPERSTHISKSLFDEVLISREHRGLRTNTGIVGGKKITVTTSGMGTPSLEIVLNELAALKNIDFKTREKKKVFSPFDIIRVGTSGGLRDETELGTLIITDYAVGFDNTGLFYKRDNNPFEELENKLEKFLGFKAYVSKSHPDVIAALKESCNELGASWKVGATISNSGFFANQGRELLLEPRFPDLDQKVTEFKDLSFENMEMEASFLTYFASLLGLRSGCICVAVANRAKNIFAKDIKGAVDLASRAALRALMKLQA
jgi:uridine phosphorylase